MVLVRYEVKERAQGQLLAGISSGAVSLSLNPGEGAAFPSTYPFVLTIEKISTNAYGVKTVTAFEDVKCTLRSTDTFTIQRGFNGTTALAFDADDYVSLQVSAIIIDDMQDAIQELETNKLNRNGQLRTWNTAWRLPYFGASGNEVELAFSTSGYVLQTNGATSAPTWVAPSVNITGLTEDTTPDHANDFLVNYDTSAGSNKKVKFTSYAASDAEARAGSNTVKYVTPKHLGEARAVAILNTTRAINAATGSVNIAHGLWFTPKYVEIFAVCQNAAQSTLNNLGARSQWFSDFTNNQCVREWQEGDTGTWNSNEWGVNNSRALYIRLSNSATSWRHQTQEATITADATNITLNFTYTVNSSTFTHNIGIVILVHG